MEQPQLTPEEKLLRIIESPPQSVHRMRSGRGLADFKFSFKILKAEYAKKFQAFLNLKSANVFLTVLAVITTVFLVFDFWAGLPRTSAFVHLEELAKRQGIGDLSIEHLDPLSIYVQEITQRNIFALPPPVKKQASEETPASDLIVKSLKENLRLVGIIWSEAPQAIIEDAKEARTYLLNRGGKVKDARIKEILKDRVILSYDNQEIELK